MPIQTENGIRWAEQAASAAVDYVLDWTDPTGAALTPSDVTWEAQPALTFAGQMNPPGRSLVRISGGTPGRWHMVRCTATFSDGSRAAQSFRLRVLADTLTELPTTGQSAWGDPLDAVMEFRRTTLMRAARQYLPDAELTDATLWAKMRAAEMEAERLLGVWLTPREVRPLQTPAAELAELEAQGHQVATDPGYDYDPQLFLGSQWGRMDLRNPHVSKVHRITFAWPSPASPLYEIPISWVRLEPRPGRLQLLPYQDAWTAPLNGYILSALGGGRNIPLMLQVSYRAGIEDVRRDYPDVMNLLGLKATLSILDGSMMPPSGSVSADGLSQSFAWDADKHRENIESKVKALRQAIRGVEIA